MEPGIALLWDKDTPFKRYLSDRGFDCEVVTPRTLAAPFFSWRACRLVIVPAGFGNAFYSKVLTDIRANSMFITNFVKAGGTLLVSGAFSSQDAYNWLPQGIKYLREERTVKKYGAGKIIATTIHEYPSEQFITYCVGNERGIGST